MGRFYRTEKSHSVNQHLISELMGCTVLGLKQIFLKCVKQDRYIPKIKISDFFLYSKKLRIYIICHFNKFITDQTNISVETIH